MKEPIKVVVKIKFARNKWECEKYWTTDRILIDKFSAIKTEGNFTWYIKKKFGEGCETPIRILCIAYLKASNRKRVWNWSKHCWTFRKPSQTWVYWRGTLYSNGYERDKEENKEVFRLQKEMRQASDFEEREMIEEEIQLEKEITKEERKFKKRGPVGLKKSPVGQLNKYEEFF